MAKTISQTVQETEVPEAIGMDNLPELPVSARQLEEILTNLGAVVTHPVRMDPVAAINGEFAGFWTE